MSEKRKAESNSIPTWGKVLLWAIGGVGVVAVALVGFLVSSLGNIEVKLTSIEDVLYVLAEEHPEKTKDLVDKLLAQARVYASAGNAEWASRTLGAADTLIASAQRQELPIENENVRRWAADVQKIWNLQLGGDINEPIYKTSKSLALYSSLLQLQPVIPSDAKRVKPDSTDGLLAMLQGQFAVTVIDGRGMAAEKEFFWGVQTLGKDNQVIGGIFLGGSQTLDRAHWRDTVFQDTHIRYLGGEVELDNVSFVNCTFEIPPSANGIRLAQHIALGAPTLTVTSPAGLNFPQ